MSVLAGVGSIIGGLGSIFGNKKGLPSDQVNGLAKGARLAAKNFGINPLTMLQSAGGAGLQQSGSNYAPLASIELITGGIADIVDRNSEANKTREAQEKLDLELAKVKLDQMRSGVIGHVTNAVDNVGTGLSPLGRNSSQVAQPTGPRPVTRGMASAQVPHKNPIAPDREIERDPIISSAGVFEIDNKVTGGPITIVGEGEPWGIDEAATAILMGGPQVAYNWGKHGSKWAGMAAHNDAERLRYGVDTAIQTVGKSLEEISQTPWYVTEGWKNNPNHKNPYEKRKK